MSALNRNKIQADGMHKKIIRLRLYSQERCSYLGKGQERGTFCCLRFKHLHFEQADLTGWNRLALTQSSFQLMLSLVNFPSLFFHLKVYY